MFSVEAFMSELAGECSDKNGLPPGFRFHPTDEELITFYLASKVFNGSYSGVEIPDLDLNNYEPWELPDAAKVGEVWYFYNLKDRKYPTGLRTNRATGTGYWKSTGKDREVLGSSTGCLLGMKKTLVYYKGRAPTGTKTRWIMHEYRLDGDISCRRISKEEWVICRISHKTGEKKSPYLKGQGYHLEGIPSLLNTNCSLQALQNQERFLVLNQQKDYTTSLLMNPVSSPSRLFSLDGCLQPTFPPNSVSVGTFATSKATDNTCKKEPTSTTSQLLKSILSHQAYNTPNEPVRTVSKKCKIETNSSHLQLQYDVADKSHPFSGVDLRSSEAASFSASTADNILAFNGLPASIDQNRGGCLQTMVDSQIIFPGESWPLNS